MTRVGLDVAQKELPNLIKGVLLGDHVLIMKDNEPIAEIVPFRTRRSKATFGSAKGLVEMSDDFDEPLEDFEEYMQ